jgi:hypothetical protein
LGVIALFHQVKRGLNQIKAEKDHRHPWHCLYPAAQPVLIQSAEVAARQQLVLFSRRRTGGAVREHTRNIVIIVTVSISDLGSPLLRIFESGVIAGNGLSADRNDVMFRKVKCRNDTIKRISALVRRRTFSRAFHYENLLTKLQNNTKKQGADEDDVMQLHTALEPLPARPAFVPLQTRRLYHIVEKIT